MPTIHTLDDIHRLAKERRDIAYSKVGVPRRITDFPESAGPDLVIRGQFLVDGYGQIGVLQETIDNPDLPLVIEQTEMRPYLYRDQQVSWSVSCGIPSSSEVCVTCVRHFTLATAWDVVRRYDEGRERREYEHRACAVLRHARKNREAFQELIEKAGFGMAYLRDVPNRYWRPEEQGVEPYCVPWFHVETVLGGFTLGWRKRVIEIDWSEMKVDLESMFAGEDVTKGAHHVHAWGYDKAREYLEKLRIALAAKIEPLAWGAGA